MDRKEFVSSASAAAVSAVPPRNSAFAVARDVIETKAQGFDLTRVRQLNGPLRDATECNRRYLRPLDSDHLLHTFRVTAGLPSPAEPMGGWER
jgi:hypothetical protein